MTSIPFGYILLSVESTSKAFRIPSSLQIQQTPTKLCARPGRVLSNVEERNFGLYETSIPIGWTDTLRFQSSSIGLRILA